MAEKRITKREYFGMLVKVVEGAEIPNEKKDELKVSFKELY